MFAILPRGSVTQRCEGPNQSLQYDYTGGWKPCQEVSQVVAERLMVVCIKSSVSYICIYVPMYRHICACLYICVHACMYFVCTWICVYPCDGDMCACTRTRVCIRAYACIHYLYTPTGGLLSEYVQRLLSGFLAQ